VAGARLALSLGVLVAVPLLALNLRPAVTSVGATLADIRAGTGMSTVLASVVVAAPVWCFAAGGALAWTMRSRFGTSRTVSLALAVLAATLAARVLAGPFLLLAGTIVACLAIAVLGTLLPVITHAAPAKAWALLTGCYIAAMGGGSGIGALVTPQVSDHGSWQLGVSGWALLAAAAWAAWRVASRKFSEPAVKAKKHPGPSSLRPAGAAWSLTIHFGLTSGFTFTIMGWLPSVLLDYSHVDPQRVQWMFTVAMALGVPVALMVPKWARATVGQSGLAVLLAAPGLIAIVGLLMFPTLSPWLWSVGLGLEMPAVGLALTMISLRAAPDGDTAAALSSMVQGIGYAIAGATALGCGLLHSSTKAWEWPLLALLVVLCGQIVSGMHAGLPIVVHAGRSLPVPKALPPAERRALPPARAPQPPAIPAQRSRPPVLTGPTHPPTRSAPPRGLPAGPQGWPAHPPMIAGWPVPSQLYAPPANGPRYGSAPRPHVPTANGHAGPPSAPLHGPFPPPLYGPFTPPRNVPAGPPAYGQAGLPHGPLPPMYWPPVPPDGPALSDPSVTESIMPKRRRGRPAAADASVTESIIPKARRSEPVDAPVTESLIPKRRGGEPSPMDASVTESLIPKRRGGESVPDAPVTESIMPKSRTSEPVADAPVTESLIPKRRGGESVLDAPVTESIMPKSRRSEPVDAPVTESLIPKRRGGESVPDAPVTESIMPKSRTSEPVAEAPVTESLIPQPRSSDPAPTDVSVTESLIPKPRKSGPVPASPSSEPAPAPPTSETPEESFAASVIPEPRDGGAPMAGSPAGGPPRVEVMASGPALADAAEPVAVEAPVAEPASPEQTAVYETAVYQTAVYETAVYETEVPQQVHEPAAEPVVTEEAGESHTWVPWVPDSIEPVQLELALETAPSLEPPVEPPLEQLATTVQPAQPAQPVDPPDQYRDRTIHIPHPRQPST
jgi:CP family cyanate transporter-like MFS transporter